MKAKYDYEYQKAFQTLVTYPHFWQTVLNEREGRVLTLRLSGMTYGDIGAEYGVGKERIRQILSKTVAKVRRGERLYLQKIQADSALRAAKNIKQISAARRLSNGC